MVSSKKTKSNKFKGIKSYNSGSKKFDSKCLNNSEVNVNIQTVNEKQITIDYSMQIVDPKNTPLKINSYENEMRVLIVPDKGGQILVIFRLPHEVKCTVQDIIVRLAEVLRNKKVEIFLVDDPVFNVRYVLQTFTDSNASLHNVDDKSSDQSKKITHTPKGLSHSLDGHCTTESRNELVTSTPKPTHLKRRLQLLTVYPNPVRNGSITITMNDLKCLDSSQYLNDIIIDFYLKYLVLETLSSANQKRIHLFSSYFYTRLNDPRRTSNDGSPLPSLEVNGENQHARVERWTKHVNIFEKDFIVIPIQDNEHWFLAIICYPNMIDDELRHSVYNNHRPCILIFESIPSLKFKRFPVAQVLKDYIQQEYKAKFKRDCTLLEYDLDAVFPDVPKQHNHTDCGLYLLQYAENFFKEFITDQKLALPLKSLQNWFDVDVIKGKRDQLKKLIVKLASNSQIFKKRRVSV